MMEAGVVLDLDIKPFYWHLPADRTNIALPDSRPLWDIIWENREKIAGIAHSHPGGGIPGPSYDDVTTFSAIERALGRRLKWWITSADAAIVAVWTGPGPITYSSTPCTELEWMKTLRQVSQRVQGNEGIEKEQDHDHAGTDSPGRGEGECHIRRQER